MEPTPLSPIEREIIADVQAVCRRCGWPADVRPTFAAYLAHGGRFRERQINALGGWKHLCALGGMHPVPVLSAAPVRPPAPTLPLIPDRPSDASPAACPDVNTDRDPDAEGRAAQEPDPELVRRLDAAMDFIRRRFRDGIDLHDVAKAAHYSPFHLHRLFHRHFGRTPKQVMTELQVAEAQRLMSAGTPLRDVAALAGFAHQSHFTSRFKMMTLTTPSRWLRGHRDRPALPPAETMPEAA